ncbi:hypothetical protein [Chthonomonas calidirosea]|uniref:Uncharacterized protein n=1 Tax=Chthonomonas calidirosea (strain DSM 23976 / ICMP 18418 / T49) TaxID=1303518 RepID=S0EVN3_CHTCT|nr:hypothetical protein [Chthonomonas calidirosea]CCW34422.1 hypothetical protein CCALI_00593 [Chthonomonas calidirosea T49]CEK13618.1 hypothetical protein CP488_00561 [Chthonomonas calidirosea]CEK14819.1 hypothetical protein CTKA_00562 [Chthonomonas calidirosea]
MHLQPFACSMTVLSVLSVLWGVVREWVCRIDYHLVYHVGVDQRNKRRARFYFWSVWVALCTTLISLACIARVVDWEIPHEPWQPYLLGILYGLGLWGLTIVALIWLSIGKRASELTLDGETPASVKLVLPKRKK